MKVRLVPIVMMFAVLGCGDDQVMIVDPPDESCADGCWAVLQTAPTKRQELQPAELDGKVYLIGGLAGTSFGDVVVEASVDVYDIQSDSWSTVAPLPEARHHVAAASSGGRLFAAGGMSGREPGRWVEHDELHEYDPASGIWTSRTPMPTARGEHLAIAFGDQIYFIGGRVGGQDTGVNEAYDPGTDTWQERAPMPTARRSFAAAVVDSLIYVVSGRLRSASSGGVVRTRIVEAYSPDSDKWYRKADISTGRGGLALGELNGILYAMGGENLSGAGSVYATNEAYDPATDSWTYVNRMDLPVHGTGAITVSDRIYVLAGATQAAVYSSDISQSFTVEP